MASDCVTTNRGQDTTYVGTGPCQLPATFKERERVAILGQRKR